MQAITTKYLSATNTRGARIKATTTSGLSATIPYPYQLNDQEVYYASVRALVEKHKLDWNITAMSYGETKDGYVFVFTNNKI